MATIIIRDLTENKELDRKAMSAVRGGISRFALVEDKGFYQGQFGAFMPVDPYREYWPPNPI